MISSSLAELADEHGNVTLARPFPDRAWSVPAELDLDGDRLVWSLEAGRTIRSSRQRMLEDFIALGETPVDGVLAYARRWGVLELCEHDFPASHPPVYWPTKPAEAHACPYVILKPGDPPLRQGDFHSCWPHGWLEGRPWEPVESWRRWARRAAATLNLAARIHANHMGRDREDEWRVACGTEDAPKGPGYWSPPTRLADARRELAYFLNHWLRAAGVTPRLEWSTDRLAVTFGGGGLFGALAVQLALAVSRSDGLTVCDGCGLGYVPSRHPRGSERHYCPECRRRGVPVRDAARDYRARRRTALKRRTAR